MNLLSFAEKKKVGQKNEMQQSKIKKIKKWMQTFLNPSNFCWNCAFSTFIGPILGVEQFCVWEHLSSGSK